MSKLHGQVVMRPKTTQKFSVSGTSAATTNAAGTGVSVLRLYLSGATADAFFVIGTAPVATVNDHPICPGTYYDITIPPNSKIAAIGTDGTLYVTEMTQ